MIIGENVARDEDESTRARRGGQLPKIGAVEEKICNLFCGMNGEQKSFFVD
jgi:hypothetical protein